MATDVANITLENGTQVRLKDDFTWEYVITETKAAPNASATAIAQPELLGSTAKDGIKVSFAEGQWKGDKLGLRFDLASTSNEHVTLVEVEASFFADNGTLLKTEKLEVWEAIFRMPETYLRKGEQRKSRVIWVEGIDKAQWQKQLINLKVTEIKSR